MKELPITALAKIIDATVLSQPGRHPESALASATFAGISTDSRTIKPGDCFFAIRGENFDGHNHVVEAFAKGASCAVVQEESKREGLEGKCILEVGDTIEALGDFAREYRRQAGFKVVAITGSVGKTTTRQITAHALSGRFRVHQSPKSFNNNIGVPLTLLGADEDTEIVVAELGSNHPGEIAYLTRIAQPDIAIVTNVHPAHLQGFGNIETIVQEKLSIAEGLGPDGLLLINARLAGPCRTIRSDCITFGSPNGDYHASEISSNGLSSRFAIDGVEINLPLPGAGNIENALAAWAVCSRLGMEARDFAEALHDLPAVSMRAEVLEIGTITVLNDCYNANPASMKNALGILESLRAEKNGRSVFVCGDMAELGKDAEKLHRQLGRAIAKAKVQSLISVGSLAQIAAENAKDIAKHDFEANSFEDVASACNNLHKLTKDYDIVLVKGSRSARLESVVEKLKELFA